MTETRQTKVFEWSEVEPALVREMLRAAYTELADPGDVSKLGTLADDKLHKQAHRTFGRPPATRFRANTSPVTRVLRDVWLPTADEHILEKLTEALNNYDPLSTRAQRLDLLLKRRFTTSYTKLLWGQFISAHKASRTTPKKGRKSPKLTFGPPAKLQGKGLPPRYSTPYPHQTEAMAALDRLRDSEGERSGLMVIPTGGGKTATMVKWLMTEMRRRPDLRVLWIADQRELIGQAVREFQALAAEEPTDFTRVIRNVHGQAGIEAGFADASTDVICTTRQTLVTGSFDTKMRIVDHFLTRPVVVVVDEAHHAVSPTYQRVLAHVRETSTDMMLVGLTATPWPAGAGQAKLLRETFAEGLVEVTTGELVDKGLLARPVMHDVATPDQIDVSPEDVDRIVKGAELPPHVLRQLNRESRNALIVRTWLDRRLEWGKTLVFACDIAHAESLAATFRAAHVRTHMVHSGIDDDSREVIEDFRTSPDPGVLISVGMLLEGVDIPSARTAFLCRPTASHVVMRQMIGRILRGPSAGGDPDAHVVDFVDDWSIPFGVVGPVNIPDVAGRVAQDELDGSETTLPPILDDDGVEIGEDLIRRIALVMTERVQEYGLTATLTGARLVGYYHLDIRRIAVFDHARYVWEDAADWSLTTGTKAVASVQALFEDVPPPSPSTDEVQAFVGYCRSHGAPPPLVPLDADVDVRMTARALIDAPPMSEHDRIEFLRTRYDSSLARAIYPTFQTFYEAVTQANLELLDVVPGGATPESVDLPRTTAGTPIARDPDRDLQALFEATVETGRELLAHERGYEGRLDKQALPSIRWTTSVASTFWGTWNWRRSTKAKGKPVININQSLQAPVEQVSDGVLMDLIWHELCHHLTPGRGHDAEFRRLEHLWPEHIERSHELQTLPEHYSGLFRNA
ncbi:DEAD/DEAH box helicase [Georgenia sp. Z1344]|uniref:DEAD/DEAH box helicase n=1 Tax=Georgenia sp. Z1344 TaxID=3416706 RepID=UPI003CFACBBC